MSCALPPPSLHLSTITLSLSLSLFFSLPRFSPSALSHRLLLVVNTLYITLLYRTRVTTRATITYTCYTICEMPSARTHLTHRRYAIRHECNVRELSNARRTINTGSLLHGSPSLTTRFLLFAFLFFPLFFSSPFVFVLSSLKCADAIPRASRAQGEGGKREGDSERTGEKGLGEDNTRGYLTNFTLTRALALSLTPRKGQTKE